MVKDDEIAIIGYCRQYPDTIAKEIAEVFGVSQYRVSYIRTKYSSTLVPRPRRGSPCRYVGPSPRAKHVALLVFQGISPSQVAKRVGLSRQRIHQMLDEYWPSMRWIRVAERQHERIKVELAKVPQQSDKDIAASLGCCSQTVGKYRNKLGLPQATHHRRGQYMRIPVMERTREACRMLLSGMPCLDIADALGVTPAAIYRTRKRWIHGLEYSYRATAGEVNRPTWNGSVFNGKTNN